GAGAGGLPLGLTLGDPGGGGDGQRGGSEQVLAQRGARGGGRAPRADADVGAELVPAELLDGAGALGVRAPPGGARGPEARGGVVLGDLAQAQQAGQAERTLHQDTPSPETRVRRCAQVAALGAVSSTPCCRKASISAACVRAASTSGLDPAT